MDDLDIGLRVKTLRTARGLTQQQLADLLSKSLIWVKTFEGGRLQVDPRLSLLKDLAAALSVPLSTLMGDSGQEPVSPIDDVRAALLAPTPLSDPGGMNIAQQAAYGHFAFQAGRWQDVVALLPRLIDAARAAEGGAGEPRELGQLADVCHLAAITLTKLGDAPGGWAAGDEAVSRAEAVGDPIEIALSAQSAIYAATAAGRPEVGLDIAHRVIDGFGTELAGLGAEGISALGMLYLKGAYAAAGLPDADAAAVMIEEGRRAAGQVAPDANHRLTGFNITNVLIYEASILGDLGRYEQALDTVTRISPTAFAGLSRERRVHHLVDTARSAQRAGRPDTALRLLLQAERDDPQNIRTWALSRTVISALLDGRQPADGRGLHALAVRAGVAE
ncbi:transcriptional regulator with XRE-family HTH domain [Catenulispora sp. MAP12-49]|uniref:helix-turn-helix domain-containing protein n=1 Tax=Catenulispora sp. MAP12-49 TaxID=3156302 RepID=UPI003516FA51